MYRVAEIEVSDVYEFEFGVIALSRSVVIPLVHGLTFSTGPQPALTSQVDVLAFAGDARCGRCVSHHFRAVPWSHRSAVLQSQAICSNASALAGWRFGILAQTGQDELVDLVRDLLLGAVRGRRRLLLHVLHQHLHHVGCAKHAFAG